MNDPLVTYCGLLRGAATSPVIWEDSPHTLVMQARREQRRIARALVDECANDLAEGCKESLAQKMAARFWTETRHSRADAAFAKFEQDARGHFERRADAILTAFRGT